MKRTFPAILCCALLGGCAWTRRENRPVWNAFEENLVPSEPVWFVAALPLTVPAGLGAILLDTVVVHPVQVLDDAWDDASTLWRNGRPDFEHRYYSEMAFLPVRGAITPIVFVGSFLGRSMFDVASEEQAAAEKRSALQAKLEARTEFLAWLQSVAAGGGDRPGRVQKELDAELRAAVEEAMRRGSALGRLQIYRLALQKRLPADCTDPIQGLRDPDPVVRFTVLDWLPADREIDPELVRALRADAVDAVRARARARWHDDP